jgi:peptide deformylase
MTGAAPVLHERAREVTPEEINSPEFRKLIEDMVETMQSADGVGLAAPQVGVPWRLFIAMSPQGPLALANPVFSKMSWRTTVDEEGCLSLPGEFDKVRRHKSLHVEGLNMDGDPVSFNAENFFARVLQHEMDHLDGILFVDRVREQRGK